MHITLDTRSTSTSALYLNWNWIHKNNELNNWTYALARKLHYGISITKSSYYVIIIIITASVCSCWHHNTGIIVGGTFSNAVWGVDPLRTSLTLLWSFRKSFDAGLACFKCPSQVRAVRQWQTLDVKDKTCPFLTNENKREEKRKREDSTRLERAWLYQGAYATLWSK
jgi:hypothetical protein